MSAALAAMVMVLSVGLASSEENDALDLAVREFISSYASGQFSEAASHFHCPPQQTPAERSADRKALAESLQIMTELYGPPNEVQPARSQAFYVTSQTACGTGEYWSEFPAEATLLFDTKQRNGEQGYLKIELSRVGGELVFFRFGHGLPGSHPEARARAEDFFRRKLEKRGVEAQDPLGI